MSNFKFLQKDWSTLYSKMVIAEERVFTEPLSSAAYCRYILEQIVHHIYELEQLDKPYNTELANLMQQEQDGSSASSQQSRPHAD